MTAMIPGPVLAYNPLESDNLKIARTELPVPVSAVNVGGHVAAVPSLGPQPVTPRSEPGYRISTAFDDWYHRIHVLPAALQLGNIAGDTQREAIVWNAYLTPVSLDDFSLTAGQGLSYSADVTPPADLAPLEAITFVIRASGDGPAEVDAEAVWTIDGVEYAVPVTGRRSVLFGFRPDWKLQRVNETYEWLNTLTTTYSGLEQVMAIREEPRRVLDYRLRLHDRDAELFDQTLFGWTGRMFGLPWWPEVTPLAADAARGVSVVYLDTAGRSFSPAASAVLFRSAHDYEMLDVAEVRPDRLVLNNTLSRNWPRGSRVVPVLPAIPPVSVPTTRALPDHLDSAVRFVASPTEAVLNIPALAPAATYRGYELYTGETNWRAPLGVELTARRKDVDGGTGPYSIRRKTDFPLVVRGFSWLLKTREEAQALLAFFGRRAGRRVPVWIPSGTEDFRLAASIEAGQSALRVRRTEAGRLIGLNEARRDLVLLVRGGQRLTRRILSIEDDGDASLVLVDQAFPEAVPLEAVKRVSYLGLHRLASDSVTFAWVTPGIAEVETNLVLKKDPTP